MSPTRVDFLRFTCPVASRTDRTNQVPSPMPPNGGQGADGASAEFGIVWVHRPTSPASLNSTGIRRSRKGQSALIRAMCDQERARLAYEAQARWLSFSERENVRLKRLVADLSLEKQVLKDVASGNL